VPSPEEKGRPGDKAPDPELSPTTNPLLAQNLGLWAQVYYTTPPEQRDEAVQKLLNELKRESPQPVPTQTLEPESTPADAGPTGAEAPLRESAPSADVSPRQVEVPAPRASELTNFSETTANAPAQEALQDFEDSRVCPACLHKNRAQQRFCGLCGFPLKSSVTESKQSVATSKKAPPPSPPPAVEPPAPAPRIERSEESWDWLRERNSAEFETSSERSGTWKYVAIGAGVLVLLLLAAIAWVSRQSSPAGSDQPAATQPTTSPAMPEASQPPPAVSSPPMPSPSQPSATKTPEAPGASESTPSPSAATPDSSIVTDADDGSAELIQARRYLDGEGVSRDAMAASHWLWKSVAKKNTQAVLLLSELYARGDGVSKSCDQARVLLQAAAERGSNEASAKLVNLRQTLCP
jgi:hypothetical protein